MQRFLSTIAVVLFVSFHGWTSGIRAQNRSNGDFVAVELSTVGLDGRTGTPIVLLREPVSGSMLPIWVGAMEAQAIALSLHGVVMPRPMTHDLMTSLIGALNAEVEEVVVTELRNNTYFGLVRLRVAGEKKVRDVDSRPSDALALALRTGAPIRVARKILAGIPEFEFIAPEGPNQVVQALGMTVVVATPLLRKELKLGDRSGVVVTAVAGTAREKGMRRGDLILEVNGKAVEDPAAFLEAVRTTKPPAQVRITYSREGSTHTIELPADVPARKPGRGQVTA
jgi:bifunctional DNase/RNase